MRTDAELEALAQQFAKLKDAPNGEATKQLYEVLNDLNSEELPRFAKICIRLADYHLQKREAALKLCRQQKR